MKDYSSNIFKCYKYLNKIIWFLETDELYISDSNISLWCIIKVVSQKSIRRRIIQPKILGHLIDYFKKTAMKRTLIMIY